MKTYEEQYVSLLERVLKTPLYENRTGVRTHSLFAENMRLNIKAGRIPMLTSVDKPLKTMLTELTWFLSGDTDIDYLVANGVNIWNPWAVNVVKDEDGKVIRGQLPHIYQHQWRKWNDTREVAEDQLGQYLDREYKVITKVPESTKESRIVYPESTKYIVTKEIDQIQQIIDTLLHNPDSRRMVLSAWNVGEIDDMALPPCHMMLILNSKPATWSSAEELIEDYTYHVVSPSIEDFQSVYEDTLRRFILDLGHTRELVLQWQDIKPRVLNSQLIMRSNDLALGNPFNVAQYSILTHWFAAQTDHLTGEFSIEMTDAHIYENQVTGVHELINQCLYTQTALNNHGLTVDPVRVRLSEFHRPLQNTVEHNYYPQGGPIKFPKAAV